MLHSTTTKQYLAAQNHENSLKVGDLLWPEIINCLGVATDELSLQNLPRVARYSIGMNNKNNLNNQNLFRNIRLIAHRILLALMILLECLPSLAKNQNY